MRNVLLIGGIAAILVVVITITYVIRQQGKLEISVETISETTKSTLSNRPIQTTVPKAESVQKPAEKETIYCGVQTMPEGVCTVINSINQDGLKNNPLVTFDTSEIPSLAKATIYKNTWKSNAETLSQVEVSLSVLGKKKTGILYIQLLDTTWKATGYSIR